jgi:hypothetical protein
VKVQSLVQAFVENSAPSTTSLPPLVIGRPAGDETDFASFMDLNHDEVEVRPVLSSSRHSLRVHFQLSYYQLHAVKVKQLLNNTRGHISNDRQSRMKRAVPEIRR